MQVLKFGGTSVANAENMMRVVNIVLRALRTDRTVLVCSAISKCTDTLIEIGNLASKRDESYLSLIEALRARHYEVVEQLLPQELQPQMRRTVDGLFTELSSITRGVYLVGELTPGSLDAIQSFGELLSTQIIAAKFGSMAVSSKWVDARQLIVTHREGQGHARKNVVDMTVTAERLSALMSEDTLTSLFIVPGFIASDEQGRVTTLGRGGSDYTASLIAACIKARNIEIWTDVSGIMTSNPKVVPTARTVSHISYRAALELSHFGAKVVYPPTIQPVVAQGIPIFVKNTFDPDAYGTLIEQNPPRTDQPIIGITNSDNIALISLEGSAMVGVPGFSSRLFAALSRSNINIILITQASSVHTMCLAIPETDAELARKVADDTFAYEIQQGKINPLKVETGFSIVCLVGNDVLGQSGATGRMLTALDSHGIRVRATAQGSSERNISVIVPSVVVDKAIRHIHYEFFDKAPVKVENIFLAGYGTVGHALLNQIRNGRAQIALHTGKEVRVCGIANSRRFVIDTEGIDLSRVDELLAEGQSAANNAYFEALHRLEVKHSTFVDCTANADIAHRYVDLFRRGYHIVACNKIPFAGTAEIYDSIVHTARANSRRLRYETTVGAALPVIEAISRCVYSGDTIWNVDALLSGTLGYIFSTYRGSEGPTFAEVVRSAQAKGYTEPDPRLDLGGRDVLRKLLIIGREAELHLDAEMVEHTPLLTPDYFEGGVEEFYARLEQNESHFRALYDRAAGEGKRLRFLARLHREEDGHYQATMGLQAVDETSPFYGVTGADNCVSITSDYYRSPFVLRGAGAGAEQTASGVLNDILL